VLSNAEVLNPKNDNFGKHSKFPGIPAGILRWWIPGNSPSLPITKLITYTWGESKGTG